MATLDVALCCRSVLLRYYTGLPCWLVVILTLCTLPSISFPCCIATFCAVGMYDVSAHDSVRRWKTLRVIWRRAALPKQRGRGLSQ